MERDSQFLNGEVAAELRASRALEAPIAIQP